MSRVHLAALAAQFCVLAGCAQQPYEVPATTPNPWADASAPPVSAAPVAQIAQPIPLPPPPPSPAAPATPAPPKPAVPPRAKKAGAPAKPASRIAPFVANAKAAAAAPLRSRPALESAGDTLGAGAALQLVTQLQNDTGDWWYVETESGAQGWLRDSEIRR